MNEKKYTLVQHTGYTVGGNPEFERAVELRGNITDRQAELIVAGGGLVFDNYVQADAREEAENYPDGLLGLIPTVAGEFVKVDGIFEPVYSPAQARESAS